MTTKKTTKASKPATTKDAKPTAAKAAKPAAKTKKTAVKPASPASLTEKAALTPMKAEPTAPAVQEAVRTPAVKEAAKAPVVQEAAKVPSVKDAVAPMVQEAAKAPAIKEKAAAPVVCEKPASAPAAKASATKAGKGALRIMPGAKGNPYLPYVATVMDVIDETHNIKTLRVVLDDAEAMRNFQYGPGQVGQLSVFGVGESTFVINSPPSRKDYLQFSVMRAGEVTEAIHKLSPGDKVGVRAPLGQPFPYAAWKGKDVFFVGGGIGMAPIRTIMLHLLENKADYGKISLLYGARSPRDMAYSYELDGWMRNPDLDCTLTIDAPFEGWEHRVGLIPHVLLELAPNPKNCIVVLCGPPIMIKFTVEALKKLEFPDENIITTLEKRMKCGIGICGRCNIGPKYVCVDGPVFSWAELKDLPPEL